MNMQRRITLLLVASLLGIVGCGGDDDSTAATDKTTTTASDDGGSGGEGDLETYCSKSAEIETLLGPGPDIDFESATPDELTQAAKDFASSGVPIAHEAQDAAPKEIRPSIDVLVASLEKVADTGDFGAFESPENDKASKAAHAFDLDSCGWQKIDVTAVNYEFKGIPDEVDAGVTSFEFSNEGTELHEMILLRKNDDTTESFDELLQLPEEEAKAKTTSVGAAFAKPGEEGVYAIADLEAGDYIALCFIPVGTVDESTEASGPPHFTQGMKHTFTVA